MRLPRFASDSRCREDARQFCLFAAGYGVVLVLGYLLLRKINLSLSVEEMGRFSVATSVVNVAMPLLYLGAPQAYLRFHDGHRISAGLRKLLFPLFAISSSGIAVIVYLTVGSPLALLYAAVPFFTERLHIFRSQMRTGAVNALKIAEIGIPLAGLCALTSFASADAGWVMALYGAGYLASFLFPLHLNPAAESPRAGTVFRFLVPFVMTTMVALLIENLTVLMARSLLGYEAAAQMGVAARNLIFIKALFSLLQMFYPVVYFREMKLGHFGTVRIYRAFILAVALSCVGLMVAFAPLLYRLTGASAYVGSRGVFMILAAAFALDFVFETFGLYFQYEIRTWKATVVKTIFLAVLLVSYVILRFSPLVPQDSYLVAIAWSVFIASATSAVTGVFWAIVAERKGGRDVREA